MTDADVLMFGYTDAKGIVSSRQIKNARQDGIYLRGFDLRENAVRTFRLDRINWGIESPNIEFTDQSFQISPPKKTTEDKPSICFTGFSRDKALPVLQSMAEAAGLHVAKSVVAKLAYLITGANAGPAKLAKAITEGATILTEDEFINLLETGELPDAIRWDKLPDPESHFKDWHYQIKKAHWPALGVQMREFVNREKTAQWRNQWEIDTPRYAELKPLFLRKKQSTVSNHPDRDEWEELKKERADLNYKDRIYALSNPPLYDFHEGDVFYSATAPYLQVVTTSPVLEVKTICDHKAIPYHITPSMLADWLQFGKIPDGSCQADKNQSSSMTAKHYEYT